MSTAVSSAMIRSSEFLADLKKLPILLDPLGLTGVTERRSFCFQLEI